MNMALKVNFSDTNITAFEAKPNGWYKLAITDCEMRKSKADKDYINYELTVQEGPHHGAKFWVNASLQPHALFTLKKLMLASGKWTEPQLASGDLEFDAEDLLGCKLQGKNVQREYNGDQQDDLKQFKAYDSETKPGGASGAVTTAKPSLMP
jgi:hypothetical protein